MVPLRVNTMLHGFTSDNSRASVVFLVVKCATLCSALPDEVLDLCLIE